MQSTNTLMSYGCTIIAARSTATWNSVQASTGAGQQDIFLVKLRPDGTYDRHFVMGSTRRDEVQSLAVDADGNFYLGGFTSGVVEPVTQLMTLA